MAELSTLGSVIKTAYEKQSNTNAFTDAEKSAVASAVQPADLDPYAKTADVATKAQGAKADSAVQPGDIGTAAAKSVGFFATSAQGDKADSAVQPDDLAPYAKTADLALSGASVAANVATGGTVDDVIASLVAAGLMEPGA